MAPRNKHPFNPVAPIYGEMPDPDVPADLFNTDSSPGGFSSRCLSDPVNITGAKAAFKKVRTNGKEEVLFESEALFLSKLDGALLEFEMSRGCVVADGSGDLNEQRDYFKLLEGTVSGLNKVLSDMHENHSRRLADAGFVLPQHLTGEGLGNDFVQQSRKLEAAILKVRNGLKGKNSGRHAELYLLIEQLADMHEDWPTRTTNTHNKDNKGAFFDLVQAIHPLVGLSNDKGITDETIISGIKLAKNR
jgi:hypothetical protein